MNWKLKCFCSHILNRLPNSVYDSIQKHLTKRWYRNVAGTLAGTNLYTDHLLAFHKHFGDVRNASYFEFGVARDLFSVLLNYCHGISRQLAVDLNPLARKELINDVIHQLREIRNSDFVQSTEQDTGPNWTADLKSFYGIDYRAPYDARSVNLPAGSIDLVASTNVFEHVPKNSIREILLECHRLCHPGSVLSMAIDYRDHYSHVDPHITPYNFLRFSDEQWRYLNLQHYYTNRLRHSDYKALFEATGFRIVEEHSTTPPDAATLIGKITLAEKYRHCDLNDLTRTRGIFVVMKKRA